MEHLLKSEWQFWLVTVPHKTNKKGGGGQYEIESICSVNTVESFHESFLQLPPVSKLRNTQQERVQIAFFRDKITPAWEDPANQTGGIYYLKASGDGVDGAWRHLTVTLIGETITNTTGSGINGFVVAPRVENKVYGIEIWSTDEEENPKMNEYLANLLSTDREFERPIFKPHRTRNKI